MKYLLAIFGFMLMIYGCESGKSAMSDTSTSAENTMDTIRIANDSLEYEILIMDLGFNNWLVTQPPEGYYSQTFLENRNRLFVTEYNRRVQNFQLYDRNLYWQEINYDFNIDYGYEVNYLLYNYFMFFQERYRQSFVGGRQGPKQ
ncbi:MAG: hypothetical protein KJO05_06110 [Bacteroidia bacterium]|nr:hypothetical protein [Bacteroidia bacterium]NNF29783.1 hypothetical protein [Flavobacteriaceae bacterium]MBT8274675.1 hypothetical protein [Bacteroidia bacterium]NNJ82162.1 hypothetical protein [Flavobacteriaceae bacterium]NNK55400.1 hypothetical protein [Flavobacteriaceae bacterium]